MAPGPAALDSVYALQTLRGVRKQVCGTSSCKYSSVHLTSRRPGRPHAARRGEDKRPRPSAQNLTAQGGYG